MSVADEEAVAALARLLGHETCVRLIDALGVGEATVSDLAFRLHLDQPRISTHLAFLREGWLEWGEGRDLRLTEHGVAALGRMGVNAQTARRSRRAFAIACPDWTELRPHLGGALGAAVLAALLDQGRARLRPGERVVDLSPGEPAAFCEPAGV